jgi:hypothetical protein
MPHKLMGSGRFVVVPERQIVDRSSASSGL